MPKKFLGFTLLELLIALFILTILSIIMVSALHHILQNQAQVKIKSARLAKLQYALIITMQDLSEAINRQVINAKGELDYAFLGSPTHVIFTHTGLLNPESARKVSSLQRVGYTLEHEQFIRESFPVIDQSPKTKVSRRLLMNNVLTIQFSYLDHRGIFHAHWPLSQSDETLPAAVRFEMTIKNWGKMKQLLLLPNANIVKH